MNTDLHQSIKADLTRDEGLRLFVYDDATGRPIRPGSIVQGHPTIGIGRCLDTHGIDAAEAGFLIDRDIGGVIAALSAKLPWFAGLDAPRAAVLAEMAFNLGIGGLLGFETMLAAAGRGDWAGAETAMESSHWAKQVGARAARLAATMRNGAAA